MSAATPLARAARAPRLVASNPERATEPTVLVSRQLWREVDDLDDRRLAAVKRLAELEHQRPAIIRDRSDEEAEAHDAAIAREKRAIERADLQRPELVQRAEQAEKDEAAADLAKRQAEATAAVDAFMATFPDRYRDLAKPLAELMAEYVRVTEVAGSVPGVVTPHDRLGRSRPSELISEATTQEERYTVYVDAISGQETANRFPAGTYRLDADPPIDPRTGELPYRVDDRGFKVEPNPKATKTRTVRVPAKYSEGLDLGQLQALVRLPGLVDGENFWGEPTRVTWRHGEGTR